MKFAAIDIGSNAVRLLLSNAISKNGSIFLKKTELVRVPLRLGDDTFLHQKISEKKIEKLITSMKAFKHLIDVYETVSYRACATSAMRDAENRWDIVNRVKNETGIKIDIIDGKTEADIIFANHIEEHLDKKNAYLYIDIGGGSTEITLFSNKKALVSQSFNIGTIRLLHNTIDKEYWKYFKNWVAEITNGFEPLIAIGSGGNINKLLKMSKDKSEKYLFTNRLKETYKVLESYTYEERMDILGLKPDRADVIVPASKILLSILKQSGIEKMIVPQFGLSDGIVHQLFEEKLLEIASKNEF